MRPKIRNIIIIAVLCSLMALYFVFDPAEHSWFPGCIIKWATGFECPACGTQRMIHALLHGDIMTALLLNPFMLLVLMPMVALIAIAFVAPEGKLEWLKRLVTHPATLILIFIISLAWGIVRNTPLWHDFVASHI